MKKTALFLFIIFCGIIAGGCGSGVKSDATPRETLYEPEFANGFALYSAGESSVLTTFNPWQGAEGVEMSVFLARGGQEPPKDFAGKVITVPVEKVVCMSSTYVAFIAELGFTDAVKGVSGARYITNDKIRRGYADGQVKEVGYDSNIDYETIAALKPDVVMIYGVAGENTALTRKFDELGIKYIYVADYLEQSPLGKAEWLVALGELFDRREQAQERFGQIRDSYLDVRKQVEEADSAWAEVSGSGRSRSPWVMLNAPYRDTWFVPGDRSYMVQLIRDAGGRYVAEGVDSDISRPISGESAFVYAQKADIWLNPGQANSLEEVKALNPKFDDIPAVSQGEVYNCNKRSTAEGGSDFWESGAVRPDIVLKDMVAIMRPPMADPALLDRELYYFKKLE